MKITETITRECCTAKDLVPLQERHYYACKHCHRHFRDEGGSEPEARGMVPLPWPWEPPLMFVPTPPQANI